MNRKIKTAICLSFFPFIQISAAAEQPLIFPLPQQIELKTGHFLVDESVPILLPQNATNEDAALARFLVRELSDKYAVALKIVRVSELPQDGKFIVMGSIDNSLVSDYCAKENITMTKESPGQEGYVLKVGKNSIVVAGWEDSGAFYGLQSLRQLIQKRNNQCSAPCLVVRDWPAMPFRGVRLSIPGTENISFFNRFLRDFMALYKLNKVVIEINCMRLDRHPEVNAGWIEFAKSMKYLRASEPSHIIGRIRNSGHQDAGDGGIVEKEDVRRIVDLANQNFIEVIPEIPSLTHGYYLLTRHPELAEFQGDVWPDTYCPSNPKSYELLFDVMSEYIDVMQPKMVHIGHDEYWGAPLGVCPRCKGKDYSDLYARDVVKIHSFLAKKGIKVAMWGDHLLESVRGVGPQERTSESGEKYTTAGGLRPSVVQRSIPKDILIFNWFWEDQAKDMELQQFGFTQLYGNFKPNIADWDDRIKKVNVIGGAPSSWTATSEFNVSKDLILDFLGCANLLWSEHTLDQARLGEIVRGMTATVRRNLSGESPPSDDGDPVEMIDISSHFNLAAETKIFDLNLKTLTSGVVSIENKVFQLEGANSKSAIAVGTQGEDEISLPRAVTGMLIGEDVSSLIFLHACAKPAGNQKSYFNISNTFDSADLLGWYEIIYEDEFVEIVPIQYGVNILEWNPGGEKSFDKKVGDTGSPQSAYCYAADAVQCSANMQDNPITFFAFEWTNSRFGKKIDRVNLKGSVHYQGLEPVYSHVVTRPIPGNAVMLIGVSAVKKRTDVLPRK